MAICIKVIGGCLTNVDCTDKCKQEGYTSGICGMHLPDPHQCICQKSDC